MATTYTCDVCYKVVNQLNALRDDIALPKLSEICNDCLGILDAAMRPLEEQQRAEVIQATRRILTDMR